MKTRKHLYRDPSRARIAGVCSGLADYFGIESWLVRILVVSAFFLLAGPFIFFGYIAAWFILDKKPAPSNPETHTQQQAMHTKHQGKGWHNAQEDEAEKVLVKSKVWQAGEPPKQAFADITRQFESNELRLRSIEKYVTSSEYQLNREINQL